MKAIALDGPAASGKGTLARKLAAHYGFAHLDTGLLYRAVGWQVRDQLDDAAAAIAAARDFDAAWLAEPELRSEAAGGMASRISSLPDVRQALFDFQRRFAATPPGAVLDGRDIGTVICPDARAKIFVTAAVETRAQRRLKELQEQGRASIYAEVLKDLIDRDARDRQRSVAPLRPAEDALLLDTSGLTPEQVLQAAIAFIDPRII